MRKRMSRLLGALIAAAIAVQFPQASVWAVDTMADWVGENTTTALTDPLGPNPLNNYVVISPTSVGGQVQAKVNLSSYGYEFINAQHFYLADQSLEGPALDFTSELHMSGTISFSAPVATEPNFFFGWYSKEDTRHRIGLGISNVAASNTPPPEAGYLRMDLGYAASGGNRFYFVSSDGTTNEADRNSVLPDGTYPFTFDYIPAASGVGGTMSTTVGTFFKTVMPLDTQPWDLDFFPLDAFGIVQRSTGIRVEPFNVTFSNVTYTGGTAVGGGAIGDFDGNSQVNDADLTIWETNYGAGTGATSSMGDADDDDDVDGQDFLIWQRNVTAPPATAAVPEPAALALFVTGALAAAGVHRRICQVGRPRSRSK